MQSFVASVIEAWAQLAPPLLVRGFTCNTKQRTDLGKAVIQLVGPGATALIEIWEQGRSLDTTLHPVSSPRGTILAGGSCQSHAEAIGRLAALRDALLHATQ